MLLSLGYFSDDELAEREKKAFLFLLQPCGYPRT
jgi:hypothetical protein